MKKNILTLTIASLFMLAAMPVLANVPAPPVNQFLGVPDIVAGGFTEAQCRECHDAGVPDRHHMLYGEPLPDPSIAPYPNADVYTCIACHSDAFIVERDCTVCHKSSPHHVTEAALNWLCFTCHGDLVNDLRDCRDLRCATSTGPFVGEPQDVGGCTAANGVLDPASPECAALGICANSTTTPINCSSNADCATGACTDDASVCYQNSDCTTGTCGDPRNAGIDCNTNSDCTRYCVNQPDKPCARNSSCSPTWPGDTCGPADTCTGAATCDGFVVCNAASCGPFGDPTAACNDGHVIPTYAPSLVTPEPAAELEFCEGTADVCTSDTDCAAGTCSTSATDCHADDDCFQGVCLTSIITAPDCSSCVEGTTCTEVAPGEFYCVDGECNEDTDCVAGTTCFGGSGVAETCDGAVACDVTVVQAGSCAFCHEPGDDTSTGTTIAVLSMHDTHHTTVGTSGPDGRRCIICHAYADPHGVHEAIIRTCENCHGYSSLHNIQYDSNGDGIVVGGELAGYGHVGRDAGPGDSDCWGCHGFGVTYPASNPEIGPIVPQLFNADVQGATVNLSGSALTNVMGDTEYTSEVTMTAADGSSATLAPASVSSTDMAVTIPAATAPGNYDLRALKANLKASNPVVISVKPEVAIASTSCNKKKKVLTVTGTGFGATTAGAEAYINVQVGGQAVDVLSWTDTEITASVSNCSNDAVTVNALMGSATSGSDPGNGGGKPDKPCKGKGCK